MAKRDPLALDKLDIPAQDKMESVMEALTDQGRADFLSELYEALAESAATNDHAPVQFVVDAWWVSRTFVRHPQFEAAVEAAQKSMEADERYDRAGIAAILSPA
jgi:hypothetical protein